MNVLTARVRLTARGSVVSAFQHSSLGEAIRSRRLPLISISRTGNATRCNAPDQRRMNRRTLTPKRSVLFHRSLGKIMVSISDELENRLREHLRKHGDSSRIVTEALETCLDRIEKKVKT